jgi:parafibromin
MDPLGLLRDAIAAKTLPILTTSSETTPEPEEAEFLEATHLYFATPIPRCVPLDSETRFKNGPDAHHNLRTVYYAYLCKEDTPQEYISKAVDMQTKLPEGRVLVQLPFVEKVTLLSWLEGGTDDGENVTPLDTAVDAVAATGAALGAVPTVSGTGVGVQQQSAGGRPTKIIDARLQVIYNGERKMGDRNTILRGIKPTVRVRSRRRGGG